MNNSENVKISGWLKNFYQLVYLNLILNLFTGLIMIAGLYYSANNSPSGVRFVRGNDKAMLFKK